MLPIPSPNPDLARPNFPQALLDSIPFGVVVTDKQLNLIQVNKWVLLNTSINPDIAINSPLGSVFPELAARNLLEAYKLVLHGGMPLTLSNRIHRFFFQIPSRDRSHTEMPQSATITPIRSEGKVIGTLTFVSDVTERVTVENNLQREVDKLNMLHEIDKAVSTLDFSACLKIIAERTRLLFQAYSVTLYLFEYGELVAAAYDSNTISQPVETGLASWVGVSGVNEYSPDVQNDERLSCEACEIRSEMAAPLFVEHQCIGVLDLQSEKLNQYTADDLELLESIATRAAISIHNARLLSSERTQRDLADSLRQISLTLAAELDLESVLDSILKNLDRVVPYDAVCVALYESEQLRFKRLMGFNIPNTPDFHTQLVSYIKSSDFFQLLEFTGAAQMQASGIISQTPALSHLSEELQNWAGAPIIIRGRMIGYLVLAKRRSRSYGSDALEHLTAFAVSAGIALENARLYTQQQLLATTDGLTGLTNRRRFDDELSRETDRVLRYKRPTSLLMIDIDDFKRYNDTYGHPAGDSLLKCLAGIMRANTRDVDILARYGGEEFAIILPEVGPEASLLVAERIRKAVEALYQQQQASDIEFGAPSIRSPITISLGLASAPDFANSPADLIHAADAALYQAKRAGKNQTVVSELRLNQTKLEPTASHERAFSALHHEKGWPGYTD